MVLELEDLEVHIVILLNQEVELGLIAHNVQNLAREVLIDDLISVSSPLLIVYLQDCNSFRILELNGKVTILQLNELLDLMLILFDSWFFGILEFL